MDQTATAGKNILDLPNEILAEIAKFLLADQAPDDFLPFDIKDPSDEGELPVSQHRLDMNAYFDAITFGVHGFHYALNFLLVCKRFHDVGEKALCPNLVLRFHCNKPEYGDHKDYHMDIMPDKVKDAKMLPKNLALFFGKLDFDAFVDAKVSEKLDYYLLYNASKFTQSLCEELQLHLVKNVRRLSLNLLYPYHLSTSHVAIDYEWLLSDQISNFLEASPQLRQIFILSRYQSSSGYLTVEDMQKRQSDMTELRFRLFLKLWASMRDLVRDDHDIKFDETGMFGPEPAMQVSWGSVSWRDMITFKGDDDQFEQMLSKERDQEYFEVVLCEGGDPAAGPCALYQCDECTIEWLKKPEKTPIRVWVKWADEAKGEIAAAILEGSSEK